ncbi:EVE domain-containing protein [Psychroflexus sp. CAK57W]|uniref:AAA family ATPase n=1 Tax=Psychroflexus curvus TaxID=2873595 RepID=UPI001CCC87ED|nr:AAA family ATPase [Psychroflexus curvus]MBZ9786423.1 EVE domain-containing protein [Psychroflexus curvus]
MHFHQQIHQYLLNYRQEHNSNFNFLVRQKSNPDDKKYPGGKIPNGLFFQGTEDYCFVGLIDKNGGNTSTRSVGLVFRPSGENYKFTFDIVFRKETDQKLISFYKTLALKFENIQWDNIGTKAVLDIGEFPKDDPSKLYEWLDENYSMIRNQALEADIKNLIPDDERFRKLQNNLKKKLEEVPINYWIFQGNPKIFDFESALADKSLDSFTVSAHKDKIKVGDKVIIWLTGQQAGCYALAEITSEPSIQSVNNDDKHWKQDNSNDLKAGIKITHNLYENPILWEDIKDMEAFTNFKAGNQGTNFSSTKDEFEYLLSLAKKIKKQYWLYAPGENARLWYEFYEQGIMGIGWDEIGDLTQFSNKKEIKKAFKDTYEGTGSKSNDVTANDDFVNNIEIGDIVITKQGRGELLGYGIVTSDYKFDENRDEYQHIRKVDWKLKGIWEVDLNLVPKTLTNITSYSTDHPDYDFYYERLMGIMGIGGSQIDNRKAFSNWLTKKYGENSGTTSSYIKAIDILSQILNKELFETNDDSFLDTLYKDLIKEQRDQNSKYYHADAPSYGDNGFYSASIKSYREFLKVNNVISLSDYNQMKYSLNTILYGPPGTGKTYHTVLRAAEIVENRKIDSYSEALDIFNSNLHNQIEFITFHQNYSYEDFIQGLRPDIENDKELTFERKDGVFKVIADKALKNLRASENPPIAKKSFEDTFNEFVNPLIEGEKEEIEVKMKKVSYFITAVTNKSIEFRKANGGTAHTLSISTLRRMYDAESVMDIQGLSSYYTPLLEELLSIGKDSSGKKVSVQKKNYIIIIDEINRANISRVFGELITLIEPDKRSHGKIPMEVRLPSGETFIVPSNLYIIGTMNTADKSIALLDIALRRRFEFESMYPKYHIDGEEIFDVGILENINNQIIKSKGHDFQIGHAYFMGENRDLLQSMNKKVIPLLLEYYMNDENEVKSILQKANLIIEEKSWPIRITGKNE